ncbi:hypothetical protein Back11_43340 [Paenibacillus baekrokdamisoli]|uniref:Uncharacterized protein n=1 Tax=Paenibacillus baekrokdamisoli TaxID=1712516 RepID=A0A3G9JIX9_9BACL|nr:hypothetical protein [Paenibacillus baekrokdamisoli]MBB3067963.1 hypothetical protein [Paenibacillus baekrokdamisoli]BBH22989.1 hypothetical protein Back11_43340 [Paenibacillus baekrokdamisoli]
MPLNKKTGVLIFLTPLLIGFLFAFLLKTHFYVYIVYILLGIVYYLLVKRFGKEISFVFLIPTVTIALVLVGQIFLLDFYDHNGLNPIKIHPLVFSLLIMIYLTFIEDLIKKRLVWDKVTIVTLIILGLFFSITFLHRGLSGISNFNHNYLAPMSFFYFIYTQKSYNRKKLNLYTNVILIVLVIIGVSGLIEYIYQTNPLQSIYDNETPTWIEGTYHEGYRIKTIIGHPLDNALVFLFSMIMVQVNVKNLYLKYPLLILFMLDILVSGSRSIFVLSFLVLIYNDSIKENGWGFIKKYLLFLTPVILLIVGLIFSPLGQTFLNRVNGADSSTEARYMILNYFFHHLFSFQFLGLGGATEEIVLYNSSHESVYLENPWIILFFEVGYFVFLFIYYLYLVIKKIEYKYFVIVLLIALSAMNSFGVKTIDIYSLFYLLAYFYALKVSKNPMPSIKSEVQQDSPNS